MTAEMIISAQNQKNSILFKIPSIERRKSTKSKFLVFSKKKWLRLK